MAGSHHSAALETLAQRLLKTLINFPALLNKSQTEETLSRLDIRNPRLDALRNTLLASIGHMSMDNHDEFTAYLHKELPDGWLAQLISDTRDIHASASNTAEASALWEKTVAAYEIAHLQVELKELEASVGQAMDEESYKRLVELQQAIHKAHAGRTFAPAEPDTVW